MRFPPPQLEICFRSANQLDFALGTCYGSSMAEQNVVIPKPVLDSVETLDELYDWLTANNPKIVAELREARAEDLAGKFKPWRPRHLPCPPTESK
jgi:hypothetical protein